jgi:hypothetical protein
LRASAWARQAACQSWAKLATAVQSSSAKDQLVIAHERTCT